MLHSFIYSSKLLHELDHTANFTKKGVLKAAKYNVVPDNILLIHLIIE